ncbi:hypothetical protein SteCoe_34826 [Stentor coeruleus]|uniref:EGF-like domain-containing protein n=1 Tax=Stentor coeruleus TaxID=5963 RepID=A0A1R2ATQ2_9CILI|nr:hypothetical protein SteCoe_34826 [Stentor coeruleus]
MSRVIFILFLVSGRLLLEYRLGSNYGPVITDFSGDNNHGVSGFHYKNYESPYDVFYTDRGAFFSGISFIKPPYNDKVRSYFTLPSTFSITMWVLPQNSEGTLMYRFYNSNHYFYIQRSSAENCLRIRFVANKEDPGDLDSSQNTFPHSNINAGTWTLITLIYKENTVLGYCNEQLCINHSYNNPYIDKNTYWFYIGSDYTSWPDMNFFLWLFAISDNEFDYLNYISSFSSEICLTKSGSCLSSCNPAIIDPYKGTGCVSVNTDEYQESGGNSCFYNKGCMSSSNIQYDFHHETFTLLNSNDNCVCPGNQIRITLACTNDTTIYSSVVSCCYSDSNDQCNTCVDTTYYLCLTCAASKAPANSNYTCNCNSGYYGSLPLSTVSSCNACYEECSTCNQDLKCLTCKSSNAYPDSIKGCNCKPGYYGAAPLIFSNSCQPCHEECQTCENNLLCLTCKSENSSPKLIQGCKCDDMYYGNSPLIYSNSCQPCYEECETCINDSQCLTCKSLNAYVDSNKGCKCNSRYYGISPYIEVDSCLECYQECSACNDSSKCTTCISLNAHADTEIGCKCDIGYYGIAPLNSISSCKKCYDDCYNCTSEFNCVECISSNSHPDFEIGCICNDGYYNTSSLIHEDSCIKCYEECSECVEKSKCTKCISKNTELNLDGNCMCIQGYYNETSLKSVNSCKKCHEDCLTCNSYPLCIICKDNNFIISKQGGCECNAGLFKNLDNLCEPCNDTCKTCESRIKCLECKDNLSIPSDITSYCIKCPDLCSGCKSNYECVSCIENATLKNNLCFCDKGYTNSSSSCVIKYFTASMSISSKNNIKINFSEPLANSLIQDDFLLEILNITFSFSLYISNPSSYLLIPKFTENIPINTKFSIKIIKNQIFSTKDSQLENKDFEGVLNELEVIVLNPNIQVIVETSKASSQIAVSSSLGMSITSNPAAAWAMINTIQLITYLPLNNNPLTAGIKKFCVSIGKYNIVPSPMHAFFNANSSSEPYSEAKIYGFKTSVFWINFGPSTVILVVSILLIPYIYLASKIKMSEKMKFDKLLSSYKYGFFLRFWIQSYLDVGFFSLIQLKSTILIASEGYFNQFTAMLGMVIFIKFLTVSTPPLLFISSFMSFSRLKDENDIDYHKKFGSLFSEFKINKGFISSQYYTLYFTKRLFFIVAQVFLNNAPFVQAGLNLTFSLISVVFLLYYQPYKETHIFVSSLSGEICVLIVFSLAFCFLCDLPIRILSKVESAFVTIVLVTLGIQFIVATYELIIGLKKMYSKINEHTLKLSNINQVKKNNAVTS